MTTPLLTTKLHIPQPRRGTVLRSRLIDRVNSGVGTRCTLLSAPAGFGKSTLLSTWVQQVDRHLSVAWLSLNESDNELTRFLTYFVAALQTFGRNIGDGVLGMLQSPGELNTEAVLTTLLNEIAECPDDVVLILDDYHVIESQLIDQALTFLLGHLPTQMHLVIATREDPRLPLARLRARGQLTELRAADLRFTSSEAAEFLNQTMGLALSADDIAALETRTEGWIAGLQLAAISLQGIVDTSGHIRSFTGSHRLVLDYLIEEVLNQQPEHLQHFLLQTAILDRLTGPLCDAVCIGCIGAATDQENGQAILEMLERDNLFIVPLDDERRWYRYHHLFADLLRQRLKLNHHEWIPDLHTKAAVWYKDHGLWPDAVGHAFAAEDLQQTADLIELAWRPMNRSYRSVTWLGWAKMLPVELVRSRPMLSTACGWASLDAGELDAAELYFQDAEQWLDSTIDVSAKLEIPPVKNGPEQSRSMIVLDEEGLRSLSTAIANGRAYLAQAFGDVSGTVEYTQRASDLLRENEYFERGLSDVIAGFAYWANGDLAPAHKAVADAIANMQMTGKPPFVISFTSYLADIMTAQGRLHETKRIYLQLLGTVAEHEGPEVPETAALHLGLSELYFEQGDMEAARRHLQRGDELGEQPTFPPWYRHWICAHVRIMEADGDLNGVIAMLDGAERLYYRHPIPDVRPLSALMTRAWLSQGKLADAVRCVREQGLSVDDDLSYLREFAHITLARLLIAQYKDSLSDEDIHDAMGLLERLLTAAEEGGRMGSIIEILVLQALSHEAQGTTPTALVSLERALALAEPEGYFRIFVDEGPPMARLLRVALNRGIRPNYIRRLLAAFPADGLGLTGASAVQVDRSELIEPLSQREIEVLERIAEGLTNREIAKRLYLSLHTVKVHTRNIYGKLDVHSRTQAIARAQELELLP